MARKIKYKPAKCEVIQTTSTDDNDDSSEGSLTMENALCIGSDDDADGHSEGAASRGRRTNRDNYNSCSSLGGGVLGRIARSLSPGTKRRVRSSSQARQKASTRSKRGGSIGAGRRRLRRNNKHTSSDSEFLRKIEHLDEDTELTKSEEAKFWELQDEFEKSFSWTTNLTTEVCLVLPTPELATVSSVDVKIENR